MNIIRHLELHYKHKYHLRFAHAKKLFVFDMTLLFSIVLIGASAIFWFTYDPTVLSDIELSIQAKPDKIKSGEKIVYNITYKNNSDQVLLDPILSIGLPKGFLVQSVQPSELYSNTKEEFSLPKLLPSDGGNVELNGIMYGTPNQNIPVVAKLSYQQQERNRREQKIARHLTIPRDSVLSTDIKIGNTILANGIIDIEISLKNTGKNTLTNINLPLQISDLLSIQTNSAIDSWSIKTLEPSEEKILTGQLISTITNDSSTIRLTLTPNIEIEGHTLPQSTVEKALTVINPKANLDAIWETKTASPGDLKNLLVNIKNTSAITLENAELEIPLPNKTKIIKKLANILPNQVINQVIPIKIDNLLGGTDLRLELNPKLTAKLLEVPNATYTKQTKSDELRIGTNLGLIASILYFTAEGDQLGRGPLPPTVGKETKYWAVVRITNTTSDVSHLNFSAKLPTNASWTGKTSVSQGKNVTYNPSSRRINWQVPRLNAHETAGINFEISITPSANDRGTTPKLLQAISINGFDTYLNIPILKTAVDLDSSLVHDSIARARGVVVE
jgi:hypothetical protein